jgi:transcriptional regulator with XRE-family HTH domain
MRDEHYNQESIKLMQQLKDLATEKGITYMQIAAKSGFSPANVFRLLTGKYPPALDKLIKLANAIGYHLEFKEN